MPESLAPVNDRLVWVDLEMTGLDVERHTIVEIACVVTNAELEALDDGIDIVVHQPAEALAAMNDVVRKMHTRSGLLTEIKASTTTLERAGADTLAYISQQVPERGTAPMCGNSIGMDRQFLTHYLPELDGYLHYRSIDVSSIKELARRWFPAAHRGRPQKAEGHRALADIRESIEELRYYRSSVFRPADDK